MWNVSCKCSHAIPVRTLHLASFILDYVLRFINILSSIPGLRLNHTSFLYYGVIIFQRFDIPQVISPLMDSGLFPPFGYFAQHCNEHVCTCVCFGTSFRSPQYVFTSAITGLHSKSIFSFLRSHQIGSHQQCVDVLISPYPLLNP